MGVFDNQKTGVRILFGVFIGIIALSMLLYLVPQGTNTAESSDVLAKVGDKIAVEGEITFAITKPEESTGQV